MFYRLLGMAVWKGGKMYVNRRYGGRSPARMLAALGGILVAGVAAVLAARHGGEE